MTITLRPNEEAKLIAMAQAKGLSPDALIHEVLEKVLSEGPDVNTGGKQPTRAVRGLFAKYGAAPSAEEIDLNRAEMFANFPRTDF